jgi:hypothetical protein
VFYAASQRLTNQADSSFKDSISCSGDVKFESRAGYRLPWLRFFVLFSVPPGKCRNCRLTSSGHCGILVHFLILTFHKSSCTSTRYNFEVLTPSLNHTWTFNFCCKSLEVQWCRLPKADCTLRKQGKQTHFLTTKTGTEQIKMSVVTGLGLQYLVREKILWHRKSEALTEVWSLQELSGFSILRVTLRSEIMASDGKETRQGTRSENSVLVLLYGWNVMREITKRRIGDVSVLKM